MAKPVTMRRLFLILFTLTACVLKAQTSRPSKQIELDNHGHKMFAKLYPATVPAPVPQPMVVFQYGGGGTAPPDESFEEVIDLLPRYVAAFTYLRPGYPPSEPDGETPTAAHEAEVLHAALAKVAPPPYLLVGHSWGGPLVRAYAGQYPNEIAGLVLIDPTDFTMSPARMQREIFDPMGDPQGEAKYEAFLAARASRPAYGSQFSHEPAIVEQEFTLLREEVQRGYADIQAEPLPSRPLVVLVAAPKYSGAPGLKLPFNSNLDAKQIFLQQRAARVASMSALAQSVPEGTMMVTPNSAHKMQTFEPEVVAWAIGRVLQPSVGRRLEAAFQRGQMPAMRAELELIKKSYPPDTYSEILLDDFGRRFQADGEKVEAVAILTLNEQEHPSSSRAWSQLAKVEAMNGDKASASREYHKALELDPKNQDAQEGMAQISAVPIAKQELQKFTGIYDLSPTYAITIAVSGDSLTAQGTNEQPLPMIFEAAPGGHPRFFVPTVTAEVEFVPGATGGITWLVLHQGGDRPAKKR